MTRIPRLVFDAGLALMVVVVAQRLGALPALGAIVVAVMAHLLHQHLWAIGRT